MNQNGTTTMAMRELERLRLIQAVIDGNLIPGPAAKRLGLTDRQIRRLAIARALQEKRYSRRGRSSPSRSNQRRGAIPIQAVAGTKAQRALDEHDLKTALMKVCATRPSGTPKTV